MRHSIRMAHKGRTNVAVFVSCMNAWGSPLLTWVRLDDDHRGAVRLDMRQVAKVTANALGDKPITENSECCYLVSLNLGAGHAKRNGA